MYIIYNFSKLNILKKTKIFLNLNELKLDIKKFKQPYNLILKILIPI
jgi:hypothetical protein